MERKTIEDFILQARYLHGDKYDYTKVSYKNNRTDIIICCKQHGLFNRTPKGHLEGRGCPTCSGSVGEKIIKEYLIGKGELFYTEHSFKDCKSINLLKFDFYLPNRNMCIEFDGMQHFKPIEFFGGECGYKETIKRDIIKNEYCNRKHIDLKRIKYNENIINKLNKIFNLF